MKDSTNPGRVVVVTDSKQEAEAYCSPSWTVVELAELPKDHVILGERPGSAT